MKVTNKLNMPQPFVDAVTREYTYKEKQYSVTSLLKGTCQVILERRYNNIVESDVSEMVWLIFGTAVHSVLERAKESDSQLKENKIVINVDGYKLSGIFDLYDEKEKKVTDYKTGTVWKVVSGDWSDYRRQTLIYAYMLRSIGFECDAGEIVMILKDHSKTKAKFDSTYPQYPVHVERFNFTDEDFEEIKKFIYEKFEDIKRCEQLDDDELPPCTPEERWHKDDAYAVMKDGRKTALKVFDNEKDAQKYIEEKCLDKKHFVEFRKGKDSKCEEYCSVKDFCPFYRSKK